MPKPKGIPEKLENNYVQNRFLKSQNPDSNPTDCCVVALKAGMGILAWVLFGGKKILFLHTTELLRYQGPPEKFKKGQKCFQRP